jgi:hypothetical protein
MNGQKKQHRNRNKKKKSTIEWRKTKIYLLDLLAVLVLLVLVRHGDLNVSTV